MRQYIQVTYSLCIVFVLAAVCGCSGGGEGPVIHSDWADALDEAEDAQDEVYTKPLVATAFTALETSLVVDAPDGIEFSNNYGAEIVYPYVLQIKVIEQVDLPETKARIMADETFKEIVTDKPGRLVVLVDSYGSDEYQFWINKTLGETEFTFTNERRGWTPATQSELDWALNMADSIRLDEDVSEE